MRPSLFAPVAAFLFAVGAAAQPAAIDWNHAARVEVALSSFKFAPDALHLKAGQPILLHLVNTGSGGHNFSAPAFFQAASVNPRDRAKIEDGAVDVGGHESVDIALVPARGQYPLHCTHAFHTTFGMKGSILVQ